MVGPVSVASAYPKDWRFDGGRMSVVSTALPSYDRGTTAEGTHVLRSATPTPGTGDAVTRRIGGHYSIDASRTTVDIALRYMGLPVGGTFDRVTGSITVPDELRSASVAVTLDAASLHRVRGRKQRWAGALLDADVHPFVHFEADRMEPILESFVTHDGDRPLWSLVGRLTLCGTTREVHVAVGAMRPIPDDGLAFTGSTTVRCSAFGVHRRGGLLADTVRVRIAGVATRAV